MDELNNNFKKNEKCNLKKILTFFKNKTVQNLLFLTKNAENFNARLKFGSPGKIW